MIQFSRTSSVAPGKLGDALGFAKEIATHLKNQYDIKTKVLMPVGGNPHRISWRSEYPDLAALDIFQSKLLADEKYLTLLGKASSFFIPGSVTDEIWREL